MAEMAIVQKPVILVPSPYVVADHQMTNALSWLKKGAAMIVKEAAITNYLVPTIIGLIENKEQQNTLKVSLAHQAKPQAVASIMEIIHHVVHYHNL